MWSWIHKYASPKHFFRLSGLMLPWLNLAFVVLFALGLYYGLVKAPADYQQGDSFRIIYIHVPAAWMSMFIYAVMAACGVITLVWRVKLADVVTRASAPIGASFTFLTLVTGSLWGKPMWGTWWEWDARLTSELILLFLYLGFMALQSAIEDRRTAGRAGAVLVLVGVINLPIIHYSVVWWNTLHQGTTVSLFGKSAIHIDMLIPLLIMAFAFKFFYAAAVLMRARCEVLESEADSRWLREQLEPTTRS